MQSFQNAHGKIRARQVRLIENWNLFVVEKLIEVLLNHNAQPAEGYQLAVNYLQHHDSQYGNGLNGPSEAKIVEMVRWMFAVERLEEAGEFYY